MVEYFKEHEYNRVQSSFDVAFLNMLAWFDKWWHNLFSEGKGIDLCTTVLDRPSYMTTIKSMGEMACTGWRDNVYRRTYRSLVLDAGLKAMTAPMNIKRPQELISIQRVHKGDARLYRIACDMRDVLSSNGTL
uniref:Uncharacterized protein n=1 Tax=Chionoecetes opilio bacilliform virus TaxID=1825681 RepID=A0A1Q3DL41_9VIRU|nr:wsv419-like protein [Chionoecetes opilio bacilliform virus]GAV93220.1 hypothetical protein SCV_100 [Chionoecetes opilio bacilliform virus]